jgi:hypothetical protein
MVPTVLTVCKITKEAQHARLQLRSRQGDPQRAPTRPTRKIDIITVLLLMLSNIRTGGTIPDRHATGATACWQLHHYLTDITRHMSNHWLLMAAPHFIIFVVHSCMDCHGVQRRMLPAECSCGAQNFAAGMNECINESMNVTPIFDKCG